MTENEIIKALECCGNIVDSTCKKCVYHETYNASCVVRLMRDALDLINRQKAEIEEFKKVIDNMADKLVQKDAEIEKAVKTIDGLIAGQKTLFEREKTAKSEATKKFAERLKSFLNLNQPGEEEIVCFEDINNLVKEMVGDDNA